MIRNIIFTILIVLLAGCGTEGTPVQSDTYLSPNIVTIDGCEYIYARAGYGRMLAHRGKCKSCAQTKYEETRNQDTWSIYNETYPNLPITNVQVVEQDPPYSDLILIHTENNVYAYSLLSPDTVIVAQSKNNSPVKK